jgi:hypothetical protein
VRLARLYEGIRYENGRWPLWRWDLNLRYLAKSVAHRREPWTEEDRAHHARARAYLAGGAWRRPVAQPARIVAGGDLMWLRSGFADALAPELRARIAAADLAIVNLETPMVPERPVPRLVVETLHYNSPPAYLEAWRSGRPRVISLCNNHALDQGPEGLARTREVVAGLGLTPLGGPRPGDEVAGVRAGDLAIGVAGVTYGINHMVGPPPDGIPVERFGDPAHEPDWARVAALVAAARRLGSDLVVLAAHWGYEYEFYPAALQRAHAVRLIELGVDVILGSSPHVLQPVELVAIDGVDDDCPLQARRGGRPRFGLIAWSLGNLASVMPTLPCRLAALLELDVGLLSGVPAFAGLRAAGTFTGRGLGGRWLDVATLPARDPAHRRHLELMLGPITETP